MNAPIRKRPTNVSLDPALVDAAREHGVNISRVCSQALEAEVRRAREAKWLEENREAIEATNRWVDQNGLPLAKYRMF